MTQMKVPGEKATQGSAVLNRIKGPEGVWGVSRLEYRSRVKKQGNAYDPQVLGYIVIFLIFTQPQHSLLVQTTLAFQKGHERLQLF